MKKMTLRLVGLLCCVVLHAGSWAGGLVAHLDRTKVVEGDPVVLTLSISGDSGGTPDFSPLHKDFDLVNQGQSNQMSFVNGRSSSSRKWHLTLMPKRNGEITIPAIPFAAGASQPLTLEVLPAAQASELGVARPVMLEVAVEPKSPYVQQKLVYTVRLLHAVPLRDPGLSEPRVGNALVQPLGKENRFETYRDGRQFQAVERRYAILPQRSGTLEIGGPVLTARITEPGQQTSGNRRDPFFSRDLFGGLGNVFGGQTRPIQVRAENTKIEVRAQPPGTPQPWLPAESLSIEEHWPTDPPVFRVGEPVTRTVIIHARGLSDEQLPEVDFGVASGVNVYPDKAQAQTRPDGDTLIAQKVIKAAIVPTVAGELTLPATRIDWWDVEAGEQRTAEIPVRRVTVAPSAATGRTPIAGTQSAPVTRFDPDRPGFTNEAAPADSDPAGDGLAPGWYWPWLTALFAVAWLVAMVFGLKRRRSLVAAATAVATPKFPGPARQNPRQILADLQRACQANDARVARSALLAWAAARWPQDPPPALGALADRLEPGAGEIFATLDSGLYAKSAAPWAGESAWEQLKPILDRASSTRSYPVAGEPLPPLYPS